jgi:dihydroxy-acid dehydratase
MLPNGSSNMAFSSEKYKEVNLSGQTMLNLLKNDIKPLDIMTRDSFLNAIKFLTLIGGSSNGVIHLLAIAKSANITLTLDDFNMVCNLPVLTNMKPHGTFVMDDMSRIGGTSSLIKYLIENNILNGNCLTITGKTLWENVMDSQVINFKENIIKPLDKPFKKTSHINILKGNMAPTGCVSKVYSEKKYFLGKAIVFDSEEEMLTALEKGIITTDHFIILRYQGESIGCPEMLQPTSALVGYFNERGMGNMIPPFATDGRFSGGSTGVLVAHLPDAYKHKSITSIIKNNDIIKLDLSSHTINIDITDNEIKERFDNYNIIKPNLNLSGYLKKYNKLVSNLEHGYLTY